MRSKLLNRIKQIEDALSMREPAVLIYKENTLTQTQIDQFKKNNPDGLLIKIEKIAPPGGAE